MSSTCGERSSLGVHASTMRRASGVVAASTVLDFVTNCARIAKCLNILSFKMKLRKAAKPYSSNRKLGRNP